MTTLDELEQKLNDTQRDLEKITADFSKFLELKNSLQSSDTSLKSSSDSIGRLAVSLEENARGLGGCVSHLQSAVAILNKIDPEKITESQNVAEHRLGEIIEKVGLILKQSEELPKKIQAEVQKAEVQKPDEVNSALIKSLSTREWILLILAIAILGATLLSLYLDHGMPNWVQVTETSNEVITEVGLADQFLSGPVAGQDYVEAARLYRLAAERGDANAQNNLGVLYLVGRGVPQDNTEAASWFRRAAEQGLAEAQYNIGSMHVTGEGAVQDNSEAVRWWRLAAAQGYVDAQYNLGVAYFDGFDVPQDFGLAAEWHRLAAEQGHAEAQLNLGRMFLAGDGMEVNNVEAFKWFILSAERFGQGNEDLRNAALEERDIAASKMSPDEISTAETLASSWTSK